MAHFADQVIVDMIGFLKKRPAAFRLARKWLANTAVHRVVTSAKKNVQSKALASHGSSLVTSHWDDNVAQVENRQLKGWMDWEFVEFEHIRPQVSGDKDVYYLQHFFREHLPSMPVARALSLGCCGGNLERALIDLGAAERVDAIDASPESIRVAIELANQHGMGHRINYRLEDIDHLRLTRNAYDFVIAKMSLHHFANLEHVFAEVRQALKPGAVFVFNEFVGPTRFQWTELQLTLINRLLQILPERHRRSASGDPLAEIARPTLEEMIAMDPTEAVRSADIIPVLEKDFEILERKDYGGTLLHPLLNHVMPTFDVNDERQLSLLRMIALFEQTLVEQKVLASDFTYVVARPLAAGR